MDDGGQVHSPISHQVVLPLNGSQVRFLSFSFSFSASLTNLNGRQRWCLCVAQWPTDAPSVIEDEDLDKTRQNERHARLLYNVGQDTIETTIVDRFGDRMTLDRWDWETRDEHYARLVSSFHHHDDDLGSAWSRAQPRLALPHSGLRTMPAFDVWPNGPRIRRR